MLLNPLQIILAFDSLTYQRWIREPELIHISLSSFLYQDNIEESEIIVDPKHHRHFVARRGEVLRQIADDYGGVTVSFPRVGVNTDKVKLKGSGECVEGAKKRIAEIVAELVCCVQ